MATIGNIEITQPLRRVRSTKSSGYDQEGWLHGIFQSEGTAFALVEDDNGNMLVWRINPQAGNIMIFIDPYSKETAYDNKPGEKIAAGDLAMSYPLVEYVYALEKKSEIHFLDKENIFDTALRCWKADHEKLDKFYALIKIAEENWELQDNWIEDKEDPLQRCYRCGEIRARNEEDKLCFDCWVRLWSVRHIVEK